MKEVQIVPIKNTNYYAVNNGEIINKHGRSLRGCKINGYTQLTLIINNKRVCIYKHRLVYEAFKGNIESNMQIHFIDGNKNNCNINNLIALTHKSIMNQSIVKAKLSVPKNINSIKYKKIDEYKI